ncbi:biotin transporter BioY [Pseudodesulfovibrio sp. F-1]|uniref:Biotin transporter n=1 Tax=Pseudodesulfovibrio alkaliphilus TaxID=2661613 RepID=A0A7K1KNW1_9BACT|nr:biotin transporter BioY [Pseudodesulfovibrio alkaliphilus]MUM77737.1 biotin transporter BioY [Pseudodesulfovibrio alkaliphilus]
MSKDSLTDLHQLVWTALLAATIGAGAYLIVPIGPVPVSMQPLFVFLAGFALGPRRGAMAVGLYLLAGALGLPVFSGGRSGLGHLFGPTGGYLLGWLLTAWVCGMARRQDGTIPWLRGAGFGLTALALLYAAGAAWLKFALSLSWHKAWLAGVVPFIPWDALKLGAALAGARYMTRIGLMPGRR